MQSKILLGLTTTWGSDWREKIKEIKKYQIKDIALFLTGINPKERQDLYRLLESVNIDFIYHVHLKSDFSLKEIKYLVDRYKVQAFNIHSQNSRYPFKNFPKKYRSMTYIENTRTIPTEEELKEFGGLCLDFSHWEVLRILHRLKYRKLNELVQRHKVGCAHVSTVRSYFNVFLHDLHQAKGNQDFDYLKKYKSYLPPYISLELENSFKDQIDYKKYIEENILK